ncbi:Uncharacterized protein BP5553_04053 [Venustampulla echinocandica]|uniref:DUF7702 domain-containing protein n=1 Tax=Venustampulla echinocandica TaxID=2656787 RepID=A0A370TW04_9HELO|nr:Uncharacterized protein BP5553_04053 [Venustampulla echinocandica]RDL39713.1 Uncharacterized protein BP5553_04053 [Venustampulla echinocandica]
MTLTYRDGLAIFEIAAYVPCLIVAVFLLVRHGFGRSAGWYFLVAFSLSRIIGGSLELATINDPTNIGLYTGSAILTNVGFSPLMLATLGLLSRLVDSINKNYQTFVTSKHLKFIETVITVGVILGIVGGVKASDALKQPGGTYQPQTLSKVGTILFIVSYVVTIAATVLISFSASHADAGEHRIILAVAFSLPFLFVRLMYSCISTFAHNSKFSLIGGSPTILLCVALIEELIVTITYEAVGLTLQKLPKKDQLRTAESVDSVEYNGNNTAYRHQPKRDNLALRIAKRTIIGRIVMALMPKKQNDVEMNQQFVRK